MIAPWILADLSWAIFVGPEALASTLRVATPLILAALGGMYCERAGVVNIGLEGMMLSGAFAAVAGAFLAGQAGLSPTFALPAALAAALLAGALAALLHAWVSVTIKADQIISGLALNLLAVGATRLLCKLMFDSESNSPTLDALAVARPRDLEPLRPLAQSSDWLGVGLLGFSPLVYLALLLVPLSWLVLFRTPFGLRIRAVGEHPRSAATLGVSVASIRYRAVLMSGLLAGLAGASLAIDVQSFVTNMSAGRGYIALAALIFGKWHPAGVFAAALIFAYPEAIAGDVGRALEARGQSLPGEWIRALPYVVTLVVLAGFVGRARPPAAIGTPYDDE